MSDLDNLSENELNDLLTELEEVNKSLSYEYIPHSKQKAFHCAAQKIRGVFGGNRSGKTEMGALEARYHATGEYPEWYPMAGRFSGPTRGRIIVTDYKKGANEVLEPKITKWFPPDKIVKMERFQGHIVKIHVRHKLGGVSTIDVMTHEQESALFEGWSGHWAWFDEPPPREQYIATMRGLIDFKGRCWLTLTPISEPWLFDEIVGKVGDRVWYTTVDIRDNPYLDEKEIADFEANLLPEEVEARIHGKFLHLAGRVYKELDRNVHCTNKLPAGWKQWPIWFVLDPADRRPHHGIWAYVDPMDNLVVFDEIVFRGTIGELSALILRRERDYGLSTEATLRVLDPNKGRTPAASTGLRLIDEFANYGVYFTANVNDDVSAGHMAVAQRLHYDKSNPLSATNQPKLFFYEPQTKECVRQLMAYVWDDWRGVSKGSRADKEAPKDVNKDMPDCVRYLVMSNPQWFQDDERYGRYFGGGRTGWGPPN